MRGGVFFADEPATGSDEASFEEHFARLYGPSFDEHFAGLVGPSGIRPAIEAEPANGALPRPSNRDGRPRRALTQVASLNVALPPTPPATPAKRQLHIADAPEVSPADTDAHTAIYDISAHRVYLPNGQRLEAHSGLGNRLDDVRYVSEKGRGPTPPNVYELTLREESFHGVRALRLNPIGNGTMYGRDGLLAHSYMLGPNGQSNGCVSFEDYQAFLNAYLSGEITQLVVVDHLANPPDARTALGWIPEKIRALFGRS